MKLTQSHSPLAAHDVWTAFAFSVALSVVTVVTIVSTRLSDAWIPAFVCFLPLSFWFAAAAHRQTRARIQVLEARIAQLEADRATAS